MTKKHHKDEAKELEKELNKELEKSQKENCEKELEKLKQENEKLKRKLADSEEILKNTQLQYVQLKNEFDAYQRRIQAQQQKLKQEAFEKVILNILPILELFIQSYEHLPEEFKEHKWTEGLTIINKKISQFLENSGIEVIPTVGEEPDETMHEIIHVQEVSDDKK
jgi:molecular chaperone GrpE